MAAPAFPRAPSLYSTSSSWTSRPQPRQFRAPQSNIPAGKFVGVPLNPADVNLYLVGFMGTGKTTVGRTVANRIGFKCSDSDHEIERASGKTIARIFAEDGEAAFRKLEREYMESGHA